MRSHSRSAGLERHLDRSALLFNLGVYAWYGPQPALAFLTGYLIEKSLSVDNIFVFALIFSYFKVPAHYSIRSSSGGFSVHW